MVIFIVHIEIGKCTLFSVLYIYTNCIIFQQSNGTGNSSARHRSNAATAPEAAPPKPDYTSEQLEAVKKWATECCLGTLHNLALTFLIYYGSWTGSRLFLSSGWSSLRIFLPENAFL